MSKNLRTREPRFLFFGSVALAAAALLSGAVPAGAASPDQDDLNQLLTTLDAQQSKLAEQERQLRQQMQQLDEQKEALRKQQQQLDALRSRVDHAQTAAPAAVAGPVGPTNLDTLRRARQPHRPQPPPTHHPLRHPPP